ncbi:MAG TPA: hypothetical protein PKO06_18420, partial [Candidatus Ozemobacteraceae bacterium]|nr:hypothetical protein [Candidatus Ozemobacteraceae bacterium]
MIPFSRWLTLVLLIWGIPAFLFVTGIGVYQTATDQRKIIWQHQQVEKRLLEFSQRCDFSSFFELRCHDLFARLASQTTAELRFREVEAFERQYPPGLVRCFLFGRDTMLEWPHQHHAPEAAQQFFTLAKQSWKKHLVIDAEMSDRLQRFLANPEGTLRILQGRPGRMLSIGTPEASFGWYQFLPETATRSFSGMLILFNGRALPDGFLPRHFAAELSDSIVQIGFRSNKGSTVIPSSISSELFHKLLRRFDLVPEDRFHVGSIIGGIQRFDGSTLIIGVAPRLAATHRLLLVLLIAYAFLSFWLLSRSYRVLVLQEELRLSLPRKTFLFMLLGLGFPLLISGMLSSAFLEEKRDTILQDLRDETVQELRQIDQGFDLFLTRRLQYYRKLSSWLHHHIDQPALMQETLSRIYRQNDIDALYMVSSNSQHLGFFRGLPIEIRRILSEPEEVRQQMFESAVERQYMPTFGESVAIAKGRFTASKANDYEQMLLRLISHAAKTAIDHYNEQHGFETGPTTSLQQLAMDGLMDDEGQQYVEAVRSQLSGLIPMSSENDFGLNYMEVIPDQTGRGGYFLILFHNGNALEHDYLRSLQKHSRRLAETFAVSL